MTGSVEAGLDAAGSARTDVQPEVARASHWLPRATARQAAAAVLALTALSVAWYYPLRRGVIAFDDIGAILHWKLDPSVNLLHQTLLDSYTNRWRPVFSTEFTVLSHFFGTRYELYFWFNVGLIAVLASLVYFVARKISSRPGLAFGVAVLTVTARFSYYSVTQAIGGPLETTSLIFLVMFVWCAIEFEWYGRPRSLAWMLVWYLLMVWTHERYSVLVVFVIIFVSSSAHLASRAKARWVCLSLLPIALGAVVRLAVLHIPLLVGTGSSQVLGFTWNTAVRFFARSILNVVGLNLGPGYLNSGLTLERLSLPLRLASICLATSAVGLVILGVSRREPPRNWLFARGQRRAVVLAVTLVGALTASFSVTIRIEPRWFYAPFVVMLLLLCYVAAALMRRDSWRVPAIWICVTFIVLSVMLDSAYSRGLEGVYFIAARDRAAGIIDATVGRHGADILSRPIYVIDPSPGADWRKELTPLIEANSLLVVTDVETVEAVAKVPRDRATFVFDTAGGFHEVAAPTS